MAHVSQKKKEIVAKLKQLIKQYPVVGIADLFGVPASQLQQIRERMRGTMVSIMSKKSLIKIAFGGLESEKKGISKLAEHFKGMPCIVLSNETAFKLSKLLDKNKTLAPAKPGQIAPRDIYVGAGPTPFSPGPVIGELGSLGIKTAVENGKIVIKTRKRVVKDGEEISEKVASILNRLGIKPMEIGIDLVAAYENGVIFTELKVDEAHSIEMLRAAKQCAFNLTIELGWVTKDNIEHLLQKASNEARTLAIEEGIVSKDTIRDVIQRANANSSALKAKVEEG